VISLNGIDQLQKFMGIFVHYLSIIIFQILQFVVFYFIRRDDESMLILCTLISVIDCFHSDGCMDCLPSFHVLSLLTSVN
jgi:hypothetical protein